MTQCISNPPQLPTGDAQAGRGNEPTFVYEDDELASYEEGTVQPRSATPWGVKSAQGERQSNEDAWSVLTTAAGIALALSEAGTRATSQAAPDQTSSPTAVGSCLEDLTLFAVYDGHGGREVAQHCADNLHRHFAVHLCASTSAARPAQQEQDGAPAPDAEAAADDDAPSPSAPGPSVSAVGDALKHAFLRTDTELAGTDAGKKGAHAVRCSDVCCHGRPLASGSWAWGAVGAQGHAAAQGTS